MLTSVPSGIIKHRSCFVLVSLFEYIIYIFILFRLAEGNLHLENEYIEYSNFHSSGFQSCSLMFDELLNLKKKHKIGILKINLIWGFLNQYILAFCCLSHYPFQLTFLRLLLYIGVVPKSPHPQASDAILDFQSIWICAGKLFIDIFTLTWGWTSTPPLPPLALFAVWLIYCWLFGYMQKYS